MTLKSEEIWRKTDLWFRKLHDEFGEFSCGYLKVSKLGLGWDPFVQSRKCIGWTIYRGFKCTDAEEWSNIWRGIGLPLQNWHDEFDKFWSEHWKI